MALFPNVAAVTAAAQARLELIKPAAGFYTNVQAVFVAPEVAKDSAPYMHVLLRGGNDRLIGWSSPQATRVREYEIEGVFKKTATEQDLANFHVDVLRAFGIGQDLPERKFPGLLDEEGDEAEYRWAVKGETTQSITIRLGIQYVQTYN